MNRRTIILLVSASFGSLFSSVHAGNSVSYGGEIIIALLKGNSDSSEALQAHANMDEGRFDSTQPTPLWSNETKKRY